MSYIAFLGRQPQFGLAELVARLGADQVRLAGSLAFLAQSIDLTSLGGSQKLARIIAETPLTNDPLSSLDLRLLPRLTGKQSFGLSLYGPLGSLGRPEALGLALKRRLTTELGGNWRFVAPSRPERQLSAAQISHGHLLDRGFELNLVADSGRLYYALSEQVQDIDWYSRRDYDRPARSAKVGMLPPKLAQILINLACGQNKVSIYDPFCGTGVVLQEALLMGHTAAGSDIVRDMVVASEQNLKWLADVAPKPLPSWKVVLADAQTVKLPTAKCTVVSEGYLGPALSSPPNPSQLKNLQRELGELYYKTLANLASQLGSGSGLCLCLPAWKVGSSYQALDVVDQITALGYTIRQFASVDNNDLLYYRPGQIVARKLLILRKT